MSQFVRLNNLISILESSKYPVPRDTLLAELEISRTQFRRDLALLRDQMQVPIDWQRGDSESPRGYVLTDKGWSSGKLGLPRTWFTASEIYALLMIDELARHIGPGLLTEHLQPLIARITVAMSAANDDPADIRSRVRILASASKRINSQYFETVAQAAVKQTRLSMQYFTRSSNKRSERIVSPQRLVHYRENWYLFAWCHQADAMRIFALDAIESAHQISKSAKRVAAKKVDEMLGPDFGIFSGKDREWAKLKFSPVQARWVRAEQWHPEQKTTELDDGSYLLEIPYSDPRELMLEILRFGPDVEVLGPATLRESVKERLVKAASLYS